LGLVLVLVILIVLVLRISIVLVLRILIVFVLGILIALALVTLVLVVSIHDLTSLWMIRIVWHPIATAIHKKFAVSLAKAFDP
jgi:hypothetical protein